MSLSQRAPTFINALPAVRYANRLVEVRGLSHVHRTSGDGVIGLHGLDLDLVENERIAVVGPSGCGKTTLLNILAGLEIPTSGSVRVAGRNLATLSGPSRDRYRQRRVGYQWQRAEDGLWPTLSVLENVRLSTAGLDGPGPEPLDRAHELLESMRLGARARLRPLDLGYEETQRLALAVALANRPQLLLADEPTAGLDEPGAERLLGDLEALLRRLGTAAVIVAPDRQIALHAGHVDHVVPMGVRSAAVHVLPDPGPEAKPPMPRRPLDTCGALRPVVLDVRSLSHRVPNPSGPPIRIDAASLTVREGELVVVLGRSNSGKSTLLALCAGLAEPDAGDIVIDGRRITDLHGLARTVAVQSRVGWVLDHTPASGLTTVEEGVRLTARIAGESAEGADRLTATALAATGLEGCASSIVNRLAGGERKRTALTRALVKNPALIIADEPAAQLEPASAARILDLLREAADSGIAVLMATSDPAVVSIADRVLLIANGSLRELQCW